MFSALSKIVSAIIPFATLASSVYGVYSGIQGAAAQREANAAQARAYEAEAAAARESAAQEEAARRDELRRVLATQTAIRAGRGLDLNDGTGRAFAAESEEDAELDISNIRSNASRRGASLAGQASAAAARGQATIAGAWGDVGRNVLSGLRASEKIWEN